METKKPYIRLATPDDAESLLSIYAPYVRNTAVSFEYEVPSFAEFRGRIERTLSKHPYLVAAIEREILGYAYTSDFVGRAAYGWSAETTIYLKEDKKRQGLGRLLYEALESISRARGLTNLYACVGFPETEDEYLTLNSVRFHRRMGYTLVGEFHGCGRKFGRWYGMVWMEKIIGGHSADTPPPLPLTALGERELREAGVRF
ncbi:MAG: GNAT family N-acetyltransferase [Oscillospiraceae bacterium]|nr:GNAT family N-acetyltransferase [Oscillospiraceae bacterium]